MKFNTCKSVVFLWQKCTEHCKRRSYC